MQSFLPRLSRYRSFQPIKKDDKKDRYLFTKIKEATWDSDLNNAYLLFYDNDGNVADSIHTPYFVWNNDTTYISQIRIPVSGRDTTYVFNVCSPGYETLTVTWDIKALCKRETYREMPPLTLKKSRVLKELTVTGQKSNSTTKATP